ncbi:hypothetical protein ACK8OR_08100 [Jannaschia sp. KMU-145]|uniref:hypothetical protein n=1 Tax=Jannaschia halovivens TaxID=3388667 RepID=UPI00396B0E0D
MNNRFLTASILALSVGSGAAMADNNFVLFDQIGNGNDALIDQDGDNNAFGGNVGSYEGPIASINNAVQSGNGNDLDLTQTGNGNLVGVSRRGNGNGFEQLGDGNRARIEQTSFENIVNNVSQDATAGGGNVLVIRQGSTTTPPNPVSGNLDRTGNTLISVEQTSTGANGNRARITQSVEGAAPNNRNRNRIGGRLGRATQIEIFGDTALNGKNHGVEQYGDDNDVTAVQRGADNLLITAAQWGVGNDMDLRQIGNTNYIVTAEQVGDNNDARIRVRGDRNGNLGFGQTWALLSGAGASSMLQMGNGNFVDYDARGDDNDFGFVQIGDNNTVGSVMVVGDGNETGISQTGDNNIASIAPIVGDDNDIGILQLGDANMADVVMDGGSSRNSFGIGQFGNNHVANLSIDGNDNGEGLFSGDAASVGVPSGLILQGNLGGVGNVFDGEITGNRNVFGAVQLGEGNDIDATVTGNRNQFAVVQFGDANVAQFSQIGNNNNLGITQ